MYTTFTFSRHNATLSVARTWRIPTLTKDSPFSFSMTLCIFLYIVDIAKILGGFVLNLRILKFDLTYITDKFHISKVFRFIIYNVNLGTSIGALRGA